MRCSKHLRKGFWVPLLILVSSGSQEEQHKRQIPALQQFYDAFGVMPGESPIRYGYVFKGFPYFRSACVLSMYVVPCLTHGYHYEDITLTDTN